MYVEGKTNVLGRRQTFRWTGLILLFWLIQYVVLLENMTLHPEEDTSFTDLQINVNEEVDSSELNFFY
jgi:hypothetical protein